MPVISKRGIAVDDRNPLTLSYDEMLFSLADPEWVAEMCAAYELECSVPDCIKLAVHPFVTFYSCNFICESHANTMDGSTFGKINRVNLSDVCDKDMYASFMMRELKYLEGISNGLMGELTKQQMLALKRLDDQEKTAEHRTRKLIRGRQKQSEVREGAPAHVAYEVEVGGAKWMAIEFDSRKNLDDIVIPSVLSVAKKFAPELYEAPDNDTGLDVFELF